MASKEIKISDKKYKVEEVRTTIQKEKGLLDRESLPLDEGMLFYFDPPLKVAMWMKDTSIPLDIIFINEDLEVVLVCEGKPNDETLIAFPDIAYVLEVNKDSGIKVGDELDLDEAGPVMKVLFQDGSELMPLWGGERIVSRRETKILIKKAKKAKESSKTSDFILLGKYIFKVFKKLDERTPEYVKSPTT